MTKLKRPSNIPYKNTFIGIIQGEDNRKRTRLIQATLGAAFIVLAAYLTIISHQKDKLTTALNNNPTTEFEEIKEPQSLIAEKNLPTAINNTPQSTLTKKTEDINDLKQELAYFEKYIKNLNSRRDVLVEAQSHYKRLRGAKAIAELPLLELKERELIIEADILKAIHNKNTTASALEREQRKLVFLKQQNNI